MQNVLLLENTRIWANNYKEYCHIFITLKATHPCHFTFYWLLLSFQEIVNSCIFFNWLSPMLAVEGLVGFLYSWVYSVCPHTPWWAAETELFVWTCSTLVTIFWCSVRKDSQPENTYLFFVCKMVPSGPLHSSQYADQYMDNAVLAVLGCFLKPKLITYNFATKWLQHYKQHARAKRHTEYIYVYMINMYNSHMCNMTNKWTYLIRIHLLQLLFLTKTYSISLL